MSSNIKKPNPNADRYFMIDGGPFGPNPFDKTLYIKDLEKYCRFLERQLRLNRLKHKS